MCWSPRSAQIGSGNGEPALTAAELSRMCDLAEEAMQSGTLVFSTGLVYAPSVYASEDEFVAVAKVVGHYGGSSAFWLTMVRECSVLI